jgi:hypothetical protein
MPRGLQAPLYAIPSDSFPNAGGATISPDTQCPNPIVMDRRKYGSESNDFP